MPRLHLRQLNRLKSFLLLWIAALTLVLPNSCKKEKISLPPFENETADLATKWADLTLISIQRTFYKSPTYISRCLGYMGVSMYECVVNADDKQQSLVGQLNGLTSLPQPVTGEDYYWPLVLHAGQDTLIRLLFPCPQDMHSAHYRILDSTAKSWEQSLITNIPGSVINRSQKLGWDIALAIFNWSKTDGGHEMFLKHWDPTYVFPKGASYWVPPVGGQTVSQWPLHPYWGNNRRFVPANSNLPVSAIIPYSTDPASDYYKIYKDVYTKNKILTQAEIDIAAWWADDPSESYSPPGHSYNLATLAIKKSRAGLVKAAEAYARTGMAVADAFINCWKTKTTYFNERPSSYVRKNIDSTWVQYWPEPPFPAFPSGHSYQSAATAMALTGLFGANFSFTDNTNEGQYRGTPVPRRLEFTRSFNSFWESAEEAAYSRFLGGIHTAQDNQVGLSQGKIVGENVSALMWKK